MGDASATQVYDPATARAQKRVGQILRDKWTLDRLLGVGGMASVYAATHRNGKRVAVKMLHPELSADQEIRARFLREGYVANKVGHVGAVSVSDDDITEDGACFLVMDLLEGETLEHRRARAGGKLDVVDVMSISDQVLDVLAAAHDKTIVHRDLKPDNLFVTREGVVKVLDFGIARLREGGSKGTHTGISMGTPSFMANEQARALWDEVDGRTDLWAIGATMFTCLTGRVVHEGRTMNEQLLSAMTKPAPFVRSVAPEVPTPIAAVIDTALAFNREDRYADARQMQAAIRTAYETMQSAPLSTAPRLVVPEVALQRTVPSAGALPFEEAPTANAPGRTGEPVVAGQTGAGRPRTTTGQRIALGGGVVALVVAAVAALVLHGTAETPQASSATAAPPSAAPVVSAPQAPATASVAPPAPSASVAAVEPPKGKRGGKGAKADPSAAPPPLTPADLPPSPPRKGVGPLEDKL
jgi:serine/threonine-protein kinase